MLGFFRKTLGSRIAVGILALVVLAFILTGVFTREMPGAGGHSSGSGGPHAAQIGDRSLSISDLDERIRREFQTYVQQQPGLTMASFVAGGGFDAITDQTIAATTLEEFGRRIGLVASKAQIDGQIAGIQAFQGPTGQFDPNAFKAVLAQQNISEARIRSEMSGDIIRQMVYLPATGAVKLADGLLRPYAGLMVEQRYGTVGYVPSEVMKDGAAPTDAELQAFYKGHLAAYSLPERRVLRYAMIGRDQVAMKAIPTEADIRKVYDSSPQKYAARETRDIQQVVIPDQAKAQAFKASVTGGKSFADAAKALGFSDKDITVGTKSQTEFAQFAAPQVAAAAFAVPQGGVTDPVKSEFGWHVVKIAAIHKVAATPYEVARPQIAGDLGKAMQDRALGTLLNGIQDQLEGGKSFGDVVKANALTVTETPPVTATGLSPDQPAYKPATEVQALLKPGFASGTDQPPTVETVLRNERYALLAVGSVIPAAPEPFAKVKDRVANDFTVDRAMDRAKALAAALQANVDKGMDMKAAFAGAPVKLQPPAQGKGRRLDLARATTPVPESLKTLFTMAPGKTKLVPVEGGRGWALVRLDKIEPGDATLLPQLIQGSRQDLTQAAGDEYVQQLSTAAAKDVGVKRDDAAIAALKLKTLGATPAAAAQ